MTPAEKEEKIKQYSEKYSYWTTQALAQFGFSNNIFLTFGIGTLAFLIGQKDKISRVNFNCKLDVNWSLTLYVTSLLFIFASIIAGVMCVISRLYDLRITRHLFLIRNNTVSKLQRLLPGKSGDINDIWVYSVIPTIIFDKVSFIGEVDVIEFDVLKTQFNDLTKLSKLLGRLSWKTLKIQIFMLVISIIIYGIKIITTH